MGEAFSPKLETSIAGNGLNTAVQTSSIDPISAQSAAKLSISTESMNADLVPVITQVTRQIITAIEGVDMQVKIGDDTIAQSAKRGAANYNRATGKQLFSV